MFLTIISVTGKKERSDPVPFQRNPVRHQTLPSSIGGLILMIGGTGGTGNEVAVITGKGKEVVRLGVSY